MSLSMCGFDIDIDTLNRWCSTNKIKLNAGKCSVLTTSHKPVKILHDYMVGNASLKRVTLKKNLGVIFDGKLNFNEHMINLFAGFIFFVIKFFILQCWWYFMSDQETGEKLNNIETNRVVGLFLSNFLLNYFQVGGKQKKLFLVLFFTLLLTIYFILS